MGDLIEPDAWRGDLSEQERKILAFVADAGRPVVPGEAWEAVHPVPEPSGGKERLAWMRLHAGLMLSTADLLERGLLSIDGWDMVEITDRGRLVLEASQ